MGQGSSLCVCHAVVGESICDVSNAIGQTRLDRVEHLRGFSQDWEQLSRNPSGTYNANPHEVIIRLEIPESLALRSGIRSEKGDRDTYRIQRP